jgi:hypothetical protein
VGLGIGFVERTNREGVAKSGGPVKESTVRSFPLEERRPLCSSWCCRNESQCVVEVEVPGEWV